MDSRMETRGQVVQAASVIAGERSHSAVADLVRRTSDFVRTEVVPVEDRHDGDVTSACGDDLRRTRRMVLSNAAFWRRMRRWSTAV
jgi:hypothetical protein